MGKILNTDVQMGNRYLRVARRNGQRFEGAFVSASSFDNVVILVGERFCVPKLEIALGSGDINLQTGVVAFSALDLNGKEGVVLQFADRNDTVRRVVGKGLSCRGKREFRKVRCDNGVD